MLAALLLAAAASGSGGTVPVRVVSLRSVVPPATQVGRRGAGWTCFPAGPIRWRDLSFEPDAAAEAVARSLSAHGVPASAESGLDPQAGGSPVLAGTIRSAAASACRPQHALGKLLGGKTKLKGRITLTVTWTAGRSGEPTATFETRSELDVSLGDPDLASLLEAGLAQVGADAAREVARLSAG